MTKEEDNYIRFAAYTTLIDFDENSLPVLSEFNQLINSSIYILPMQLIAQKLKYDEACFTEAGNGVAMYVSETRHYIILYDEHLSAPDIRWTIARLLYLVNSGKLDNQPDTFHFSDCPEDIEKSNAFAYYFTCPDVILKECGITSASDIIKYCEIPFAYANTKSRFQDTAATSKSLQFIEKIVTTNFSSYIEQLKSKKKSCH